MRRAAVTLMTCAAVALLVPARAAALPPGAHVQLFKGGLNFPVDMAYVPNSHKLFFTEKNTGAIRVILNGKLLPAPCLQNAQSSALPWRDWWQPRLQHLRWCPVRN